MFGLARDLLLLLVRGAKTRIAPDLLAELGLGHDVGSGWVDAEHLCTIWKALDNRSRDANLGLHLGEIKGPLPASKAGYSRFGASEHQGRPLLLYHTTA